jgi:hypothetical protein
VLHLKLLIRRTILFNSSLCHCTVADLVEGQGVVGAALGGLAVEQLLGLDLQRESKSECVRVSVYVCLRVCVCACI